MRIRIATEAWDTSQAADGFDSANAGVLIPWVEIDGHRVTGVQRVKVRASEEGATTVTIKAVAAVEVVLDDGRPPIVEIPSIVTLTAGDVSVLVEWYQNAGEWVIQSKGPGGRAARLREPVVVSDATWEQARAVAVEVLMVLHDATEARLPTLEEFDVVNETLERVQERQDAAVERIRERIRG